MILKKTLYIFLPILILFSSCKEDKGIKRDLPPLGTSSINLKYATGFSVTDNRDYKILTIESDGATEEGVKATLQKVGFKAEAVD